MKWPPRKRANSHIISLPTLMSDGMSKKLSGWKKGRPCFFVNPFLIWFHVGYPSPDDLISLLNVNQDLAFKKTRMIIAHRFSNSFSFHIFPRFIASVSRINITMSRLRMVFWGARIIKSLNKLPDVENLAFAEIPLFEIHPFRICMTRGREKRGRYVRTCMI